MKLVILPPEEFLEELRGSIEDALSSGPTARPSAADSAKDWLTNGEAQDYLGLSRPTLQRYRSSGILPFSKIGGKVYYRRGDIETLLEENLR